MIATIEDALKKFLFPLFQKSCFSMGIWNRRVGFQTKFATLEEHFKKAFNV